MTERSNKESSELNPALEQHRAEYIESKNLIDGRKKNYGELAEIETQFQENYLKIKKYKYSITDVNVKQLQLDNFMAVSKNGEELLIYNQVLKQIPSGEELN